MTRPTAKAIAPAVTASERPQPDRHAGDGKHQKGVQGVECHHQHRRQTHLPIDVVQEIRHAVAHIGVFEIAVGEHLDGFHIGVAVDHAAGDDGAVIGLLHGNVFQPRHEVAKRQQIAQQPQHHRCGEAQIADREQYDGGGEIER